MIVPDRVNFLEVDFLRKKQIGQYFPYSQIFYTTFMYKNVIVRGCINLMQKNCVSNIFPKIYLEKVNEKITLQAIE